jgi:hypothetical protein
MSLLDRLPERFACSRCYCSVDPVPEMVEGLAEFEPVVRIGVEGAGNIVDAAGSDRSKGWV